MKSDSSSSQSGSQKTWKPGMKAAASGTYQETGPRGGHPNESRTVEMKKGDTLPPTSRSKDTWSQQ